MFEQRLLRYAEENNREYIYRSLRHAIMTLQLLPQTVLNEESIAAQFNVSRTPVHEAIIKLKEEFLVEVRPQSGSFVTLIDIKQVNEGHFMRSTIEPKIVSHLAGFLPLEYVDRLQKNLMQQQQSILDELPPNVILSLDDQFHQMIYEAANKPHIWMATKNVNSHFDRLRFIVAKYNSSVLEKIYNEHKRLYNILLIGMLTTFDFYDFYDAHLSMYEKSIEEIVTKHPDYFDLDSFGS